MKDDQTETISPIRAPEGVSRISCVEVASHIITQGDRLSPGAVMLDGVTILGRAIPSIRHGATV